MSQRLPFRNLEPTFCSGLFDDPLLQMEFAWRAYRDPGATE